MQEDPKQKLLPTTNKQHVRHNMSTLVLSISQYIQAKRVSSMNEATEKHECQ